MTTITPHPENLPEWFPFRQYLIDNLSGTEFSVKLNEPLPAVTDLGQSKYDFKWLSFPADLGMDYNGHYLVININVPTSGFKYDNYNRPIAGNYNKPQYMNAVTEGNMVSKVDGLRFGPNNKLGVDRQAFSIPRQTRRIAESIAIFLPNSGLTYTDHNHYEPIDMTAMGADIIGTGIESALTLGGTIAGSGAGMIVGRAVGSLIHNTLGALATPGGTADKLARIASNPINPGSQILFSKRGVRTFVMDWLLAPRNELESANMESIIRTLRFHAAPEINETTFGATWIPPADFDLTFFKHGVENTKIPRINTCVLESITVDYQGASLFSTFTNGHPVFAQVRMEFAEVEPLHKKRIIQGF